MVVGFLPLRAGSKSIPKKNKKIFCGKPLFYWQAEAMIESGIFDRLIVSTDDQEIKDLCKKDFEEIEIHHRGRGVSRDVSSTESVIYSCISDMRINEDDIFVLAQATNPFVQNKDYVEAYSLFLEYIPRIPEISLLSVSETSRFYWGKYKQNIVKPLYTTRLRRQDYDSKFGVENGGFYINTTKNILKMKNRLTNSVIGYTMPEWTNYEIDEPIDWKICEIVFQFKVLGVSDGAGI